MRSLVSRAALIASLAAAAPAIAQPAEKPPSAERKRSAKTYVDAGLVAQRDGDYDGAITLYQKAYALVPHPALLFNMAQAHRLAGRRSDALDLYRQYIAAVPTGDLVVEAKQWIADIEGAIARETEAAEAAERARREAEERAREDAARAAAAPAAAASPEVVAPTPPPPASTADGDRGRTWRIAGIATAGAGVATIAVGGLFGLRAKSISDDLSEHNAVFDPDKDDDGKAAERTMFVLYGVGGALVVGGVVAYVLHRHVDEESPAFGVAVVPSGATFTVGGRF